LRTYSQEVIEEFAQYSQIPVINGLSDRFHPCQILSDFMTILEAGKDPFKSGVVWIGDGNNMANSWVELSALLGFPLVIACPEGFEPDQEVLKEARERFSAKIKILRDPKEAIKGAEIVNTDVWTSMGQEEEEEQRKRAFKDFQLNEELLSLASPEVIVLHCLPAHRGEEITEAVLEGPRAVVWDQAENKMWLHMALLEYLID
jgi:ornithine carbamoyltransferase